nr:EOG090X0JBP [Artemia franciscana]
MDSSSRCLSVNKKCSEFDTDVHILEEDQQKINKFARLNARFEELKDELKSMQNDLKNIEDASDDIMLLDEAAGPIPFMIGEAFIHCSQDEAQERLSSSKTGLENQMKSLEYAMNEVKSNMSDLKTQLYAKFGSNINLEADEE